MNIAVILAGGTGTRVGAKMPKQFILFNDKSILAYTVDLFQQNPNIDAIEIVCHRDWIEYVTDMVKKYDQTKVKWITNGGDTFQESTVNGILNLKDKASKDDIEDFKTCVPVTF